MLVQNGQTTGVKPPRPLKFEFSKCKMAAKRPFVKTVKSRYIRSHLAVFGEIWCDDAHWPQTAERPLKFPIFELNM